MEECFGKRYWSGWMIGVYFVWVLWEVVWIVDDVEFEVGIGGWFLWWVGEVNGVSEMCWMYYIW